MNPKDIIESIHRQFENSCVKYTDKEIELKISDSLIFNFVKKYGDDEHIFFLLLTSDQIANKQSIKKIFSILKKFGIYMCHKQSELLVSDYAKRSHLAFIPYTIWFNNNTLNKDAKLLSQLAESFRVI